MNPLRGDGYQFWSGIGATLAPLAVGACLWLMPTRCEQLGCRRRARGLHPVNGRLLCARHLEAVK